MSLIYPPSVYEVKKTVFCRNCSAELLVYRGLFAEGITDFQRIYGDITIESGHPSKLPIFVKCQGCKAIYVFTQEFFTEIENLLTAEYQKAISKPL